MMTRNAWHDDPAFLAQVLKTFGADLTAQAIAAAVKVERPRTVAATRETPAARWAREYSSTR